MFEEFQSYFQKEEDRRFYVEDNFNRNSNIMVLVKVGVEYLFDKFYYFKVVSFNYFRVYIYKFYFKKLFQICSIEISFYIIVFVIIYKCKFK